MAVTIGCKHLIHYEIHNCDHASDPHKKLQTLKKMALPIDLEFVWTNKSGGIRIFNSRFSSQFFVFPI